MFKSLDHLKMDEIIVLVHSILSMFNFANVLYVLSGVLWQQSL